MVLSIFTSPAVNITAEFQNISSVQERDPNLPNTHSASTMNLCLSL